MKWVLIVCFLLLPISELSADNKLIQRLAAQQEAIQLLAQQLDELRKKFKNLEDKLNSESSSKIFGGKVSLSKDGRTVVFSGVNVQIVNGKGKTNTTNGLGNLIVGYNELLVKNGVQMHYFCTNGEYQHKNTCEGNNSNWGNNQQKTGSHNIVGGIGNSYTQYGGMVIGIQNIINRKYSVVSGGLANQASGELSNISGGYHNIAIGRLSSISGGFDNIASGKWSTISGGYNNRSDGQWSSISGGSENKAIGTASSISGGAANIADGYRSSISGGVKKSVSGDYEWRAGEFYQTIEQGSRRQLSLSHHEE
ncbi:hypothetical protein [Spartinivicinus ruber]|uniref:hypothetical protein n=1 Tax=Spartinivicinus ruber TaxID=2683272 RepID=UPI0013D5993F|nr:hypothetical protein [Spartinivicinus ruber]